MSFHNSPNDNPDKAGAKVVGWLILGLVVLFGGLYVVAHLVAGDKVPRGTTVAGVSIGGHSQAEAADRLRAGFADRADREMKVTVDGEKLTFTPDEVGLDIDYEASVAEAGGERSWDPVRLWNYFTGGDDMGAVVAVDDVTFTKFVASIDKAQGTAPVDGAVAFDGAEIERTEPVDGEALDPTATLETMEAAYLSEEPTTAELELVPVTPAIDADDVQEALDSFASPAVASPVVLDFEGSRIKVAPAAYTAALSLEPQDGELVPTLQAKRLAKVLERRITTGAPHDASFRVVDGRPQIVPSKKGVTFDEAQLEASFLDLVVKPEGKRTLALDAKVAEPDFTTADAKALKITERVSSFTTYYPHADYRNTNIGRAAQLVNGTVLEPGETFSLNGIVGERTEANGFTKGYVISDGILIQDLGGGVSQMATTLFNAMFFAGLEDVEHKPHSFYISRYPIGREATVAWGAVDLRFKNDTPYGVLVQATVTPSTPSSSGVVTVNMYSTKWWDISTTTGERHNLTKPKVRKVDSLKCHPNEGYGGFDIDVIRYFRPVGANTEKRSPETFSTTYIPSDTVKCTNPDAVDE